MKLDILAIGAHPDDIELSAAGSLLKHIASGYKVGLLDLSQGELGTRGSAELRRQEGEVARNLLGALSRENVKLADGFFEHNETSIKRIIPFLRSHRPDIVLANALKDRHPDHGRAAKLTADACYYSGLQKIISVDSQGQEQSRWRPRAIYHYIQDFYTDPDIVVDISDHLEKKIDVIKAFRSQFYNPESKDLNTPISGKDFIEFIKARARQMGRLIGVEFAEGFISRNAIPVGDLCAL
jgi:bacillithiol biosynthesis deacetylase BshB1